MRNSKNWFDNFCAESRAKFFEIKPINNRHLSMSSDGDLLSADECYNLIRLNIRSQRRAYNDVLWQIPMVLLTLGCLLVLLITFSFILLRIYRRMIKSGLARHLPFDISQCETPKSCPKWAGKKRTKCCVCGR
ncbi:hypothetical protein KR018_006960 [Drosophila ironensis]|nr:hypothetical protein KR018_006960 [Drosophila ironensis]